MNCPMGYRQLTNGPQPDRLADTTAIPPLSRLFMVGMGMNVVMSESAITATTNTASAISVSQWN